MGKSNDQKQNARVLSKELESILAGETEVIKDAVAQLHSVLHHTYSMSAESIRDDIDHVYTTYRRAMIWLNILILTGQPKATGACANVVDKLYWVVKDQARLAGLLTEKPVHGEKVPWSTFSTEDGEIEYTEPSDGEMN